jgi:hypothetical protein
MTLDVDGGCEFVNRRLHQFAADRLDWEEDLDQVVVLDHFYISRVHKEELVGILPDKVAQLILHVVQVA